MTGRWLFFVAVGIPIMSKAGVLMRWGDMRRMRSKQVMLPFVTAKSQASVGLLRKRVEKLLSRISCFVTAL